MLSPGDLFPDFVACVALCEGALPDPLFPEEAAHVARAVEKRRLEYALGRTCARRALAALGVPVGPLLSQPDRSVAWPQAAWGSITHADGYCAGVAALRRDVRGLGIDVEVMGRVQPHLWRAIATERERAWLEQAPTTADACARATRLFSAKEAFYKAQYCVSQAWVGFHDAEIEFDDLRSFEITLLIDAGDAFCRGTRFVGKAAESAEHVITGVVIAT